MDRNSRLKAREKNILIIYNPKFITAIIRMIVGPLQTEKTKCIALKWKPHVLYQSKVLARINIPTLCGRKNLYPYYPNDFIKQKELTRGGRFPQYTLRFTKVYVFRATSPWNIILI